METIVRGRVRTFAGRAAQTRLHGVPADVLDNPFQFVLITHPMIVRFVLPELPRTVEQFVGSIRSITFQAVHDRSQRASRIGDFIRFADEAGSFVYLGLNRL